MKQNLTFINPEDGFIPIYNVELEAIFWWDSLNKKGKDKIVLNYFKTTRFISRESREIVNLYESHIEGLKVQSRISNES